ncbi:MAG: ABC transporter permease [Candidatus Eremiobacteraeota bacterium]|nr:ABC transporter permease [Candidatus Eremiobacteraeota bacterium]MBC5821800.1 ABC transporter permease [Candidatus Eremiobacteraeota bacterium]
MEATSNPAPACNMSSFRPTSPLGSFALEARLELVRLARQPSYVLPLFAFPLAFYYFFGISMGEQRYHGVTAATYLLASYGAFGVIGAALFGFGVTLALERGNGWLILRRASPMRLLSYLSAKMVAALGFALAVAGAIELLGALAGGVRLAPQAWLLLLGVLVAGAIPFCALGFAIGTIAPANGVPAIVNLIYLPLSFMGGLWIPAAMLPVTFARIAPWTPTYHFGKLALAAIGIGNATVLDSLALVLWTALFLALAAFGWRRDESRSNG